MRLLLISNSTNPGEPYLDLNPAGHAGKTREQRIEEFIEVNPDLYVAGLREGTLLTVENNIIKLFCPRKARIFKKGHEPVELGKDDDLNFLL